MFSVINSESFPIPLLFVDILWAKLYYCKYSFVGNVCMYNCTFCNLSLMIWEYKTIVSAWFIPAGLLITTYLYISFPSFIISTFYRFSEDVVNVSLSLFTIRGMEPRPQWDNTGFTGCFVQVDMVVINCLSTHCES